MPGVDPFAWAARIGAILDSLGIRYAIGGSVASMLYGEMRLTHDLAVVVDVDERTALLLVTRLKDDFYVEEEDAIQAVRYHTSFNAIHFASLMKIDFFVAADQARTQLERSRSVELAEGTVSFCAPEDVLVRKLLWFRMGGEQSEQQWRDIVGILRLRQTLDEGYLAGAAEELGVTDLLRRARQDAAP